MNKILFSIWMGTIGLAFITAIVFFSSIYHNPGTYVMCGESNHSIATLELGGSIVGFLLTIYFVPELLKLVK